MTYLLYIRLSLEDSSDASLRAGIGFKRLYGCDYIPAAIVLAYSVCQRHVQYQLSHSVTPAEESSADRYNRGGSDGRRPCSVPDVSSLTLPNQGLTITLAIMDIMSKPEELPSELPVELTRLKVSANNSVEAQENDLWHSSVKNDGVVTVGLAQEFRRFDLIHDKGTFDVFFMRGEAPLYIDSICRHFVQRETLICVTSCNATEAELLDCFEKHQFSESVPLKNQFQFQCISTLPHRSFTFGGAGGQSVSTAAFRAIEPSGVTH